MTDIVMMQYLPPNHYRSFNQPQQGSSSNDALFSFIGVAVVFILGLLVGVCIVLCVRCVRGRMRGRHRERQYEEIPTRFSTMYQKGRQ